MTEPFLRIEMIFIGLGVRQLEIEIKEVVVEADVWVLLLGKLINMLHLLFFI